MLKPRLFIRGESTDNTWMYCGGPDIKEMFDGVSFLFEDVIEILIEETTNKVEAFPPNWANIKRSDVLNVELQIRLMTDEEVENIPDY